MGIKDEVDRFGLKSPKRSNLKASGDYETPNNRAASTT
jgi:hypothetical protein